MARGKIDFAKLAMAFVVNGNEGVVELENRFQETVSKNVLERAIKHLQSMGNTCYELQDLMDERFPDNGGQRGRKSVQIGESREYTVGQVLTLANVWGFEKGQKVLVTYNEDGVTIRAE